MVVILEVHGILIHIIISNTFACMLLHAFFRSKHLVKFCVMILQVRKTAEIVVILL